MIFCQKLFRDKNDLGSSFQKWIMYGHNLVRYNLIIVEVSKYIYQLCQQLVKTFVLVQHVQSQLIINNPDTTERLLWH